MPNVEGVFHEDAMPGLWRSALALFRQAPPPTDPTNVLFQMTPRFVPMCKALPLRPSVNLFAVIRVGFPFVVLAVLIKKNPADGPVPTEKSKPWMRMLPAVDSATEIRLVVVLLFVM